MRRDYNQQIGETYDAWRIRILKGIASGEVDMTWLEACILLGMKWDIEKAQELGEAYLDAEQEAEQRRSDEAANLDGTSEWDALDEKIARAECAKIQAQDQKRMNRAALRKIARAEHLIEIIERAIRDTDAKVKIPENFAPIIVDEDSNEGVLLLSDWHKGQYSDNEWNTFNDTVFFKRIEEVIMQTIEYGQLNNVKVLHVFALGDLVNGLIHISTRINNEENVVQQTIAAAQTLINMLERLSHHFEVHCYFSRGNHDRVSANKKEEIDSESFFDILKYIVQASVGEGHPRIIIEENDVSPEIIRAEVAGHLCFAMHGHKDKPNNVAKNMTSFMQEFPEFIFLGHFHSPMEQEVNGTEVIVNGCLCGTDDFAVSLRRNSSPTQKFIVINKDGRLCTYNLMLSRR